LIVDDGNQIRSAHYLMDPSEYWAILRRRRWNFLVPFSVVLLAAVMIAWLLPPTFRAQATILIQRQAIPQNLVATTVTGYVQEQIEQIRQQIVTHTNLMEIAEKFDMYPGEQDQAGIVREMRRDIEVSMVEVEATDPDRAGTRVATVAFNVAFNANSAELAKRVTDDLAERFLDVHVQARTEAATKVFDFLDAEADNIKVEIADLEKQLAGFKQEEIRQLPELMGMNLSLYERTEREIEATETRIRELLQRIDVTRAELSLTEPYDDVVTQEGERMLTASERLGVLSAQYLQATARYSSRHPDVVRLTREISILAEQTGDSARADELMKQLISLQEQLRQARQKYTPGHPEVTALESAVAAVQRGMQTSLISQQAHIEPTALPPDNPRYVALQTQLTNTQTNLVAEEEKLAGLQLKLQQYEDRLFQTPIVERDYKSLSRGYDDALRRFSDLNRKQLEAQLAVTLEASQGAEQWTLANRAFEPFFPESPNRVGIVLLGVLFALAVGLAFVTVAEFLDKTINSARKLTSIVGTPPLAVIPRIAASDRPSWSSP
tara:strand:+ start:720 stop:2372 length:1653 start_codon:yes stop_codon:yes gene_type:complete